MTETSNLSTTRTTLELHGAAASSSPHSLVYLPSDETVIYPSSSVLNLARPNKLCDEEGTETNLYHVDVTLRTNTVPRKDWMRCITTISLLKPANNAQALNIVACAFSDGTLTLWKQNEDGTWKEDIVMDITDPSLTSDDVNVFSITNVGGLYSVVDDTIHCMLVTSSSQGVDSFSHTFGKSNSNEPSRIGNYACCSLKMCIFEDTILLAVGSAMPRNNRIHF